MARGLMLLVAMVGLLTAVAVGGIGAQELHLLKSGGKINMVFLAEAYVQGQKQVFLDDADLAWRTIFDKTPFKENAEKFSIYAIWTASRDTMLSEVPNSGKTYFGIFPTGGYHQGRIDSLTAVFFPMRRILTFPYLLVNDDRIWGSGTGGGSERFEITLLGTGRLHHETNYEMFYRYAAVHEFAHSFAGLADEYDGTRTWGYGEPWNENEFPNITRETRREFLKWRRFIDTATPVPTPEDADKYGDVIGLFDGAFAYKKGQGWYRPSLYCLMGNRNNIKDERIDRFCLVCRDQIEQRVAALTAIREKPPEVDFYAPVRQGQPPLTVEFSAVSKGGPVMEYRWNFGDGETAVAYANTPGVTHTYRQEGSYTVTLAAQGPGGAAASTVRDYIIVSAQKPTPDFNGDRVVDFTDFFWFADNFGAKTSLANFRFDLDGDGRIGLDDFFIFAQAFGRRI